MTNENESNVKATIDAVTGLVKAIPVYDDAIKPAAKELGKSLELVAKTINMVLTPISALIWGYEKIQGFVSTTVAEKLKDVPPERLRTPSPTVAGPALEALRYTGHEELLRELYANLLATAIDTDTAVQAHPAFVEIIKNMSPDEARIMRLFATSGAHPVLDLRAQHNDGTGYVTMARHFSLLGDQAACAAPELAPNYLDNLSRLGLVEITKDRWLTSEGVYDKLESDPRVASIYADIERSKDRKPKFDRIFVQITSFGKQFLKACVIDKSNQAL